MALSHADDPPLRLAHHDDALVHIHFAVCEASEHQVLLKSLLTGHVLNREGRQLHEVRMSGS